jgi:hypothetical protein
MNLASAAHSHRDLQRPDLARGGLQHTKALCRTPVTLAPGRGSCKRFGKTRADACCPESSGPSAMRLFSTLCSAHTYATGVRCVEVCRAKRGEPNTPTAGCAGMRNVCPAEWPHSVSRGDGQPPCDRVLAPRRCDGLAGRCDGMAGATGGLRGRGADWPEPVAVCAATPARAAAPMREATAVSGHRWPVAMATRPADCRAGLCLAACAWPSAPTTCARPSAPAHRGGRLSRVGARSLRARCGRRAGRRSPR